MTRRYRKKEPPTVYDPTYILVTDNRVTTAKSLELLCKDFWGRAHLSFTEELGVIASVAHTMLLRVGLSTHFIKVGETEVTEWSAYTKRDMLYRIDPEDLPMMLHHIGRSQYHSIWAKEIISFLEVL